MKRGNASQRRSNRSKPIVESKIHEEPVEEPVKPNQQKEQLNWNKADSIKVEAVNMPNLEEKRKRSLELTEIARNVLDKDALVLLRGIIGHFRHSRNMEQFCDALFNQVLITVKGESAAAQTKLLIAAIRATFPLEFRKQFDSINGARSISNTANITAATSSPAAAAAAQPQPQKQTNKTNNNSKNNKSSTTAAAKAPIGIGMQLERDMSPMTQSDTASTISGFSVDSLSTLDSDKTPKWRASPESSGSEWGTCSCIYQDETSDFCAIARHPEIARRKADGTARSKKKTNAAKIDSQSSTDAKENEKVSEYNAYDLDYVTNPARIAKIRESANRNSSTRHITQPHAAKRDWPKRKQRTSDSDHDRDLDHAASSEKVHEITRPSVLNDQLAEQLQLTASNAPSSPSTVTASPAQTERKKHRKSRVTSERKGNSNIVAAGPKRGETAFDQHAGKLPVLTDAAPINNKQVDQQPQMQQQKQQQRDEAMAASADNANGRANGKGSNPQSQPHSTRAARSKVEQLKSVAVEKTQTVEDARSIRATNVPDATNTALVHALDGDESHPQSAPTSKKLYRQSSATTNTTSTNANANANADANASSSMNKQTQAQAQAQAQEKRRVQEHEHEKNEALNGAGTNKLSGSANNTRQAKNARQKQLESQQDTVNACNTFPLRAHSKKRLVGSADSNSNDQTRDAEFDIRPSGGASMASSIISVGSSASVASVVLEVKKMQLERPNFYEKFGFTVFRQKTYIVVASVEANSEAWLQGLRVGDRILKLNRLSAKNTSLMDAVQAISSCLRLVLYVATKRQPTYPYPLRQLDLTRSVNQDRGDNYIRCVVTSENGYYGFALAKKRSAQSQIFIAVIDIPSPAHHAGLRENDVLVKVNEVDISTMDYIKLIAILKGSSTVTLTIKRD